MIDELKYAISKSRILQLEQTYKVSMLFLWYFERIPLVHWQYQSMGSYQAFYLQFLSFSSFDGDYINAFTCHNVQDVSFLLEVLDKEIKGQMKDFTQITSSKQEIFFDFNNSWTICFAYPVFIIIWTFSTNHWGLWIPNWAGSKGLCFNYVIAKWGGMVWENITVGDVLVGMVPWMITDYGKLQ